MASNEWAVRDVRSPTVLSAEGFTLLGYEGWSNTGLEGIGFALARDRWIHPESSLIQFSGGDRKKQLVIENLGLEDLIIQEMTQTDPAFYVLGNHSDMTIPSFSKKVWDVIFTAISPGIYESEMHIASSDPEQPEIRILLQGVVEN